MPAHEPLFPAKVRVQLVRESNVSPNCVINSIQDVKRILGDFFRGCDREYLLCLHLSANNSLLGIETISIGSLTFSVASPREIIKGAILSNACNIILCHNHPSGNLQPSEEDIRITKLMTEVCHLFDIKLHDHLIFAGGQAHSIIHQSQI